MREDYSEGMLWKEKVEVENPQPIPDEEFIPAKEAEDDPDTEVLIHVDL